MTKILLIHGINNQGKSEEIIRSSWGDALRKGAVAAGMSIPDDVTFHAAFYGDLLHEETESWVKSGPAVTPMGPDALDSDYVDDRIAELYIEYQRGNGISDAQVALALDPGDEPLSAKRMAKGVHKKWLKAIARALESILPDRGKAVARQFLRQASAYLQKPGLKARIDAKVREQLFDSLRTDEEVVVIGHSLGSVIAYDLLRRLHSVVGCRLLLTCGSPLGVNVVKVGIGPPLRCLPNVKHWLNVSDEEDFVALHPELTVKSFGCDQVHNMADVDNGVEDAHDVLRYLAHPAVFRELRKAL